MRSTFSWMLCVALFITGFRAVADGPHWQVPNPEYNPEDKDKKKRRKKRTQRTRESFQSGYKSNPGDFLRMDEACIKYYENHCSISYSTGKTALSFLLRNQPAKKRTKQEMRRDFYLLIMQRCAQAMREVDRYLPCPDSYLLWHEEALRELMVQYAQRTWELSTRLPPADAAACAEYCAKAFLDTVRFSTDMRGREGPIWVASMGKRDQEIAKLLEQMAAEKDPKKLLELRRAWLKHNGLSRTDTRAMLQNVRERYATYVLVTGDIPVSISDAEVRMAEALTKMGPQVIPYLKRDPSLRNPRVRRAAEALIETIRTRWNLNRDGISMNPTQRNVTDLLRKYAAHPGADTSLPFRRALEEMGPKAWDHMVRLAQSEPPKVKKEALRLLCAFTEKPDTTKLEEIRSVVADLLAAEKAREERPAKPPVPIAPEDEEE